MKVAQKIVILVVTLAMLPLSGCFFKKKKPPVPPPQGQAPTITVPITPAQLPPEAPPATPPPAPTTPTKPPVTKPKPKHRAPKKGVASNPPATTTPTPSTPATTAKSNPAKTVTDGGANDSSVQISAEVPRDAAAQQRQDTTQLLESTEANLRKVGGRSLNDNDQATMRQIRNYITQSRLAMQDGDLERAYNLATKANLLCNEFVKRL